MATSNQEYVGKGLELLKQGLLPFAYRELRAKYKDRFWSVAVEPSLTGATGLDARRMQAGDEERFMALDVPALFAVMQSQGVWKEVFENKLGRTGRSFANELSEARNKWAHQQAFSLDDAHRALDTMTRLLQMVSAPESEQTDKMARELLRQRVDQEAKREQKRAAAASTESRAHPALKPWRAVVTPHPDVASGRYRQAEFAADLSAVVNGYAEAEYSDPHEFFRRTYLTEGLTRLLTVATERLAGKGGEPVVDLQTNFGGGKTHSLLAVYHLFGGAIKPGDAIGLDKVIRDASVKELPVARRAVLVGQNFNPAAPQIKSDGTEVHTFWGELAWQIGGKDGYRLVAEADRDGVNPGSGALRQLFDAHGPVLVLIDEWTSFLRTLYGTEKLSAGTFETNVSFAQSLTEAANQSKSAMVIVSLPQSDIEKGGPAGDLALASLKQFVGRQAAPWKPAGSEEGFEIVRRRLFLPIQDLGARDQVCRNFAINYRDNKGEYPKACAEAAYEQRMRSAYPIHPELFDRLYQDWSTLEQFQLTRGVLRLMAAVIHALWVREDRNLFIMPGNLPMDNDVVRNELTRYLPDGWSAVLDTDIDGPNCKPLELDQRYQNLGRYSASRRVARTVFLGSAPSVATQKQRGLEEVRVRLGCVQPGESAAIFGDALRRLSDTLSHLFNDGSRYWYDVHRNIVREAQDRAAQLSIEAVHDEVIRRLRAVKERGAFGGVHVGLPSSDIADEDAARLVVLGPASAHAGKGQPSAAIAEALEILDKRGSAPRLMRNMLVFLAADKNRVPELEQAIRQYLAWKSILEQPEFLNLDKAQERQAGSALKTSDDTVTARLKDAYSWLLVPQQEGTGPLEWDTVRLMSGEDNIVLRASKKLESTGQIITRWSGQLLRLELDKWLWKDRPDIGLKKVWDALCRYPYFPRLKNSDVLLETVREGVRTSAFGYAVRTTSSQYEGLVFGKPPGSLFLNDETVLITPDAAQKQLDEEATRERERQGKTVRDGDNARMGEMRSPTQRGESTETEPAPKVKRVVRFFGTAQLDPNRLGRDAGKIAEEVVQHLTTLTSADVDITLEIHANVPFGVPDNVVRTVAENCRTLKFRAAEFEEE